MVFSSCRNFKSVLCFSFSLVSILIFVGLSSVLPDENSIPDELKNLIELKRYQATKIDLRSDGLDRSSVGHFAPNELLLGGSRSRVSASCSLEPADVLVLVHSAPGHRYRRDVIRDTWASKRTVGGLLWKTMFLLGAPREIHLQKEIQRESTKFNDLVQGNFVDDYRNLTEKHLMGYNWALRYCPNVEKILKVDDDVFVDPYRISSLITETLRNTDFSRSILCSTVSDGTLPQRTGTRKVTREEYAFDTYPSYCSGMAYLIGVGIMADLLRASCLVPHFWVDDVYVTGILVAALGNYPTNLLPFNVRYTDNQSVIRKWLNGNGSNPFPYAFAELVDINDGGKGSLVTVMTALWRKTLKTRGFSWHNFEKV